VSRPLELPEDFPFDCRIGRVAALLGEKTHTIRFWEQEFDVRPERSRSGQRVYSRSSVARFIAIHDLLRNWGFTIAGARKRLTEARK
jgi:DNA-binding transcriptional MerR regulator